MTFQVLDYKENNFLNLINDDNLPTKPTYTKYGTWFKHFGHSNILCLSRTKEVDLKLFLFSLLIFIFFSIYFSLFYF